MLMSAAPHSGGTRHLIRIWRSDALAPTSYRLAGELVLDRDLLGEPATQDPHKAPLLTWHGDKVRVTVRNQNRVVFGIPGRLFDDLPVHPGAFGRYWTWVTHSELGETLMLMSRQPPLQVSSSDGTHHMFRMDVCLRRGNIQDSLNIAPPCVIVAGRGAVEISDSSATTRLTRPEPLATFDPNEIRRRIHFSTATRLSVPCIVPNSPEWHYEEGTAVTRLAQTLDGAYRRDPPDWLLMPTYLHGSVPGVIVALRRRREQCWIFRNYTALEDWVQQKCELERHPDEGNGKPSSVVRGPFAPEEREPDKRFYGSSSVARDQFTSEERELDRRTDKVEVDSSLEHLFPDFVCGQYVVKFDSDHYRDAARIVVKGGHHSMPKSTPAAMGAWRRVACIYAIYMQRNMQLPEHRDLRKYGWSNKMAECVERWVDILGTDTRAWLSGDDGPRIFSQYLTVKLKGGGPVLDATEPLAALIDTLVRPHGKTTIGKRR
ncbi:hypothetical protein [Sorangium sp. So ce1151]|uniref:hypothetical protein n=1 Tax=Sorangium sp. So ce1151 TaxID=3133332 RepID=UPI003F64914E